MRRSRLVFAGLAVSAVLAIAVFLAAPKRPPSGYWEIVKLSKFNGTDLEMQSLRLSRRGGGLRLNGWLYSRGDLYYSDIFIRIEIYNEVDGRGDVLGAARVEVDRVGPTQQVAFDVPIKGEFDPPGVSTSVALLSYEEGFVPLPTRAEREATERRIESSRRWAVVGKIWLCLVGAAMLIACGYIGKFCGRSRRRERAGFVLGLLLGPVGCVLALFLPPPLERDGSAARDGWPAEQGEGLAEWRGDYLRGRKNNP